MKNGLKSTAMRSTCLGLATAMGIGAAWAQDEPLQELTFLTAWFAQAEHGGFYQAQATGLYEECGLDVTINMGGPQVNSMQLLVAGDADIIMGYDIQTLNAIANNLPVVTVGTSFQKDLRGILAHDDVESLADLGDKRILVATAGHGDWWPWLKAKYGYTDDQVQPYTFNLQPFFTGEDIAQQAYVSSEPFQAQQEGIASKFFLLADEGYPPYGTTMVTTRQLVEEDPEAVQCFVEASLKGWKDYLSNPEPGNALIKEANPDMTDEQIDYAIEQIKAYGLVGGGEAATEGIGTIAEERWKQTYDFLVKAGLLDPEVDWRQAFTTEFVDDLDIMLEQ